MLEGFIPSVKRLLLLILVGCAFFVSAQAVFAQAFPPGSPPDPFTPPTGPGGAEGFEDRVGGGTPGGGSGNLTSGELDNYLRGDYSNSQPPTAPAANPSYQVTDSPTCWSSPAGFFHCIMVSFFGSFVAVAGYAFDASIGLFIKGFGEMYVTYGIGSTVEAVWGVVRDVFNLTFIFGLVYIGFQIILGINESSAKRTLPLLVLAALLVNFSLFIVKFVIDFANLAAIQIYNLFTVAQDTLSQGGGQTIADGTIVGILGLDAPSISLAFINTLGLTSLLNHSPNSVEGVPIFYTFGMIVVFLVVIYVFFAAAILITIRFAVLNFYMIFSPVMFLGWVFPGFKSYSDKFWRGLFGQAFFAPALLFMLYVTYQLSAGFNGPRRVSGSVFQNTADDIGNFAMFIPYLILIIVFLVASLIVARKMADSGGSMVMKANNWAVSRAQSYAGRNTLGRISSGLYNVNEKMDGTKTGRLFKTAVTAASLGTFDERTRRGVFESGKKSKFGGSYSRADDKAFAKERTNNISDQEERVTNKQVMKDGLAALAVEESIRNEEQHKAIQKMSGVVSKMGLSDVEKMDSTTRNAIAPFFTYSLNEKIGDSKEMTDTAKYAVKTARKEALKKLIGQVGDEAAKVTAEVAKLTIEQIEELGDDWVMKNADILTTTQMDKIKDSKKFNPYQKNQFSTNRAKLLSTSDRTRDYFFQIKADQKASRRKASEVAGLGRDVFMRSDDAALEHLNVDILEAIADKKTLGADDRRILSDKIKGLEVAKNPEAQNMRDWLLSPQGLRTWGGKGNA